VKRLKADCEHQVELEHIKYTTLEVQHAALKERLSVVNSSLFTLEKQFLEFKAAQRCTSEAELVAEIIALKQQCTDLESKTAKALRARNDYKAQVQNQWVRTCSKLIHCLHESLALYNLLFKFTAGAKDGKGASKDTWTA